MNRTRAKITAMVFTAVFAAGLTPNAAFAHGGSSGNSGSSDYASSQKVVFELWRATARYHSVKKAIDDGYTPFGDCVELPGKGAMGVHFVKNSLIDGEINPSKPEALVYMPQKLAKEGKDGNGEKYRNYRLVAAEFLSDTGTAPVLGGVEFDSGGIPGMYTHSLHAWVWKYNPTGTFMPWNPSISCPK